MQKRIPFVSSLVLVVFAAMTVNAQQLTPTASEKAAMRVIDSRAKGISAIAYPTTTFSDVEYDGGTRNGDGSFSVTYTFNGKWNNNQGYFTQTYVFNKQGKLLDIKNGGKSWFLSPFDEWELARGLIREVFKDDLRKNPQLENALRDGTGKSVIVAVLNDALGFKD